MTLLIQPSIFHPSDFSEGDEGAFAHALRLALLAKAELTLLHVDEPATEVHWSDFPSVRETLRKWHGGDVSPEAISRMGLRLKKVKRVGEDPARAVVQYVAEHRPSLIVLATHQREGLSRWLNPAIAEPISRESHTLTLFVPRSVPGFVRTETGAAHLRRILIPLAPIPEPQRAVDAAVGLAVLLGALEVHFELLHVGEEGEAPLVTLPERPGWTSEVTTWSGHVVDHVLNVAETQNVDLIVMATAGHRGFLDALRGSTTEQVLRGAPCPLLAVPAW